MLFKLKFLVLLLLGALSLHSRAQTQKLGHVNTQKVVEAMPAYKEAEKKLKDYVMQLERQLTLMQDELEKMMAAYETGRATMSPPIIEIEEQKIQDAQKRIQQLQYSSEKDAYSKQAELLKPLEEQVMAAIKAVAAEKGYAYIFDASQGMMLYGPPSDDITEMVKAKVGAQ